MPTTTVTVSNQYLSTTLYELLKTDVDQLHRRVSWFDASKAKFGGEGKPQWDGGPVLLEPWAIDEHSTPTTLSTGYETINLDVTTVDIVAQWTWFSAVMPIVISGTEERINNGKKAVASILEHREKAVMGGFRRKFVQQTFAGNVASFSGLATLNGIDSNTGFLEEVAVGGQTNTVGGIVKTTYAALPGCQNQVYNGNNSFNTNGLAALIHVNQRIQARHPGDQKPDAWFFSEAFSENQKRALMAYERYVDGANGKDPGLRYAVWDGVPCYTETYLPNNGANTTTYKVSAYAVSLDYLRTFWHPDGFFQMTEFKSCQPQQDVRAALVLCMCQNVIGHCGSQGLIYNADTF